MKHIRAVVNATTNRPKRRPIILSLVSSIARRRVYVLLCLPKRAVQCGDQTDHLARFSPTLVQMQLRQAQRQLLSRCTLRYYSAGAVSGNSASDVVAAAGTSVSPRLKRPLASSFGGISIRTRRSHLPNTGGFSFPSRKCCGTFTISLTRAPQQNKQTVYVSNCMIDDCLSSQTF